ncbi:hypothetical protein LOZ86_18930 [Pectobacterium parvum]|uniref:Secretory protein invB n=1 Tax=Pectobacterium parvum TaxID=2778550 RepID=A0AAP9IEC8_9GAMM|nr:MULTISPECIES: surface presentation of antigens, secretory protein invB [Pectobacterium]GKW40834.1 surface presentation of antigens protein SpaK [Pectobacterium carotovorum subsp. carotovorum]KFX17938.1 secretory protein invB [Pectobacterium parvum]MCU1800736.1 hypothetical protein [Pectobacterium parvum]QHQ23270.1 hypothetical protein GMX10_03625 [Pectobacterium parvum]UFK38934.1 hypothetical protein LOZ86_18930 [Pectobacterium parvum]
MKHDVVALISEMLNNAGVEDILEAGLSNHSTISLNMKDDIPTIHIKSEDDEVWVWAKLCDYNISSLSYCSANLFPLMLDYNESIFYAGQPCLYPIDGILELRAQVKEPSLTSSDAFMEMLNHYLSIMQDYRRVLI